MTSARAQLLATLSPEFLTRYDVRGPRYTSYPTVPHWKAAVDGAAWLEHLAAQPTPAAAPNADEAPLSLYVHIPFCHKHCSFCACNVIITEHAGIASRYLDSVEREVCMVADAASAGRRVIQLHLGGGTPNYLNSAEMARLMAMLRGRFSFHPDAEISIEVDPRTSSPDEIRRLRRVDGFNRISFGVQDFHAETQAAIGRSQTFGITQELVAASRGAGFASINVDLIYGLPEQSRASWRETIDRFLEMRPSRLALYNFAFLPGKLAHQRRIDIERLPSVEEKLEMFTETNERLLDAGYRFIGMDHYALEEDELTRALDDGTLHRNFMGYTTLRGTDMFAFGVSSISDAFDGFAQNTKKLSEYERELAEGRLPVEHGLVLSADDRRRRWIIESIMCSGRLDGADYAARFGHSFAETYAWELERLAPLEADGLVERRADGVLVTALGRFFLRNIAMVFDAYLPQPGRQLAPGLAQPTYSRTL